MPSRRCLECNRLTQGTRCDSCRSRIKAIRNADAKIAAAVVAISPVCSCTESCSWHSPGYCGATTDLTADHIIPISRGGTNEGLRRTLCRRCNTARRNRI